MKITLDKANVAIENGKVIVDIGSAQIDNILNSNKPEKVELASLKVGETFKIGDEDFIVLKQDFTQKNTFVISKNIVYYEKQFGECSDWKRSPIRSLLNSDYYNKIVSLVGKNNLLAMGRNLTSLDGLGDYGWCFDYISL